MTAVTETRRPLVVPGDKVALAMMIPADGSASMQPLPARPDHALKRT